jgi:hypothetical protein
MRWSLSRLRPVHIVLLSTAYWLGLLVVKLGAAIVAAWQVSHLPPNHGTISAGLENLLLRVTIARDSSVVWAGSVSLGALVGWVVGPPLLLALTCRWAREAEANPVPALPAPSPQWHRTADEVSEARRNVEGDHEP